MGAALDSVHCSYLARLRLRCTALHCCALLTVAPILCLVRSTWLVHFVYDLPVMYGSVGAVRTHVLLILFAYKLIGGKMRVKEYVCQFKPTALRIPTTDWSDQLSGMLLLISNEEWEAVLQILRALQCSMVSSFIFIFILWLFSVRRLCVYISTVWYDMV
jgi:hypothetical protein